LIFGNSDLAGIVPSMTLLPAVALAWFCVLTLSPRPWNLQRRELRRIDRIGRLSAFLLEESLSARKLQNDGREAAV